MIVEDEIWRSSRAAQETARHRALASGETVLGLALPAGAVLAYSDETRRTLVSVDLPQPMRVAGLWLEGEIKHIVDDEWDGTLARDQTIGDWPCKAGWIWFTSEGAAARCTLSHAYRLAGYDLPAGASAVHDARGWEFQTNADSAPLRVGALDADLPPGGSIYLRPDGTLRGLYVTSEAGMSVAGVALYQEIRVERGGLTGVLAQAREIGGVMAPRDAIVWLDPRTGAVEVTKRAAVGEP